MKKMLVLAIALVGFLPASAGAQIKAPPGFVEFTPKEDSAAARLQAGLRAAQQEESDTTCLKEKFSGIPEQQLVRVLLHCAAVESFGGSEDARMAQAQSYGGCAERCMFQGARVLKRFGFEDVAILLGRREGRWITLFGAAGPDGKVLWTSLYGSPVGESIVKSLRRQMLVTPKGAYIAQS
jgi:hypothetical protein